jgi:hypothetical protein
MPLTEAVEVLALNSLLVSVATTDHCMEKQGCARVTGIRTYVSLLAVTMFEKRESAPSAGGEFTYRTSRSRRVESFQSNRAWLAFREESTGSGRILCRPANIPPVAHALCLQGERPCGASPKHGAMGVSAVSIGRVQSLNRA